MSVEYEDLQTLQEDTKPSKGAGATNQILQAIMMKRRVPELSSSLICFLSAVCTGLIFIIIILIVTITRQGVGETEQSLEVKLRNMSIEVHSRVDQLYVKNSGMTEKLTDFEIFMEDFNKHDVAGKVTNIKSLVNLFLSEEITGSLTSDNQRILAAVGKLTDGLRNSNGSVDPLCGSEWTHYGLNCYYLSHYARPWDYAKKHCEDKKSHLVVIKGLVEMNFLRNVSQSQGLWIGLSSDNDILNWVDGTSYERSPKFWNDDEPQTWYRDFRYCAYLKNGENWSASFCSRSYRYVCEKKTL
ncbi:asialoglycoprotein receptor 1-like [Rana temporaria]|uniref:asialoglycoprotein receptor 1-like n=1 Tax=Rana temporaria TaxID=8407 RepID=UPI001AAC992A|nr:asialoglycoprotein receptor 1-like [Rana temporaria]